MNEPCLNITFLSLSERAQAAPHAYLQGAGRDLYREIEETPFSTSTILNLATIGHNSPTTTGAPESRGRSASKNLPCWKVPGTAPA
jgi:hypothetical protein